MALHNISPLDKFLADSSNKGFTLLEVIITIAIFTSLLAVGVFISIGAYRGYLFRAERTIVVSTLERARSRALNNYEQSPWGVCINGNSYVIFKGSTCTTGESIPANSNVSVTGLGVGVVFSQLSGTTTDATVTLTDTDRTSTITINHEGAILW